MIFPTKFRHEPVKGWLYPVVDRINIGDCGGSVTALLKMPDGSVVGVGLSAAQLVASGTLSVPLPPEGIKV